MRKLFTLLTLLALFGGSKAWAQEPITVTWFPDNMTAITTAGTADVDGILVVNDATHSTPVSDPTLRNKNDVIWAKFTSTNVNVNGSNKNRWLATDYITFSVKVAAGYSFTPTSATAVAAGSGSSGCNAGLFATKQETAQGGQKSGIAQEQDGGVNLSLKAFSKTSYVDGEELTLYLHVGMPSGKGISIHNIVLTGTYESLAPAITTQPQSASYVTGATIEPLTVAATASAGELTYQWYQCDDADKTNAAAIDGATSASYAPTEAGFYYVTVTDSNGSVDSEVAEIIIASASAPTISVSGAPTGDILVGTEVTLTAEATGNPTPTITWYDSNDAEVATGETYSPSTSAAGTYTFYAVASNGVGTDATSQIQTIVVKEQAPAPTFTPNGAYFETSQEVTISSALEGATIKYSTDEGATWNDYSAALTITETTTIQAKVTQDGYFDSEVATATFSKVELANQVAITGITTWDWSKYGTKEINTSGTAFNRTDVLVANVAQYGFAAPAEDFGPAQSLVLKGDYIVRDSKYCQVTNAKFTTTVPGIIDIEFSNTGGNRPYRYIYVNGNKTEFGSNASNVTTKATGIFVPAGDVDIYGVLDPDAEDEGAGKVNFIRIFNITFTPMPAEVSGTITASGYNTYSSNYPVDLSTISGGTAYVASGVEGGKVVLTKCTEKIPAGTGIMIAGEAGATFTIGTYSDEATLSGTNLLVGMPNGGKVAVADEGFNYVFGWTEVSDPGFYKVVSDVPTLESFKAYLHTTEALGAPSSARLGIVFDSETTGISTIGTAEADSRCYNLQGQTVAQPQRKGLYIVSGKKVIMK